nr:protein translocase subunit SecF [Angustibacter aerolatus]
MALAKAYGVDADRNVTASFVGPSWGQTVSQKALTGLIVFLVLVALVISIYFRNWKVALAAVVALLHDLVITVGIYALFGFEVTPASVIGFLTILGYSLYDTVVVFDKVRENTQHLSTQTRRTYSEAANLALNQTLVRSINTSVVALLPIAAILFIGALLLGAGTLEDLALALFVGVAAGTYSSLFIATPLLADLREREPEMQALAKRVRTKRAEGPGRATPPRPARGQRGSATAVLDRPAAVDAPAAHGATRLSDDGGEGADGVLGRPRAGSRCRRPAVGGRRHGRRRRHRRPQPAAAGDRSAQPAAATASEGPPLTAGRLPTGAPAQEGPTALLERVRGLIRDVPDFPTPGVVFKDIAPLLGDGEAFAGLIGLLADRYRGRVDVVAGIEARGFVLGAPLAVALGVGFVPVRKAGKPPGETVAASLRPRVRHRQHRGAARRLPPCLAGGARRRRARDRRHGGRGGRSRGARRRRGRRAWPCSWSLTFLGGRSRLGDLPVHVVLGD